MLYRVYSELAKPHQWFNAERVVDREFKPWSNHTKNYYPLANEVAKGYSNATIRPSFHNILVNTRINIFQWILTKLGTYLVLKRIWNPIDFQGHRSKSPGQIFRRGDTPRFALPLLNWYLLLFIKAYSIKV